MEHFKDGDQRQKGYPVLTGTCNRLCIRDQACAQNNRTQCSSPGQARLDFVRGQSMYILRDRVPPKSPPWPLLSVLNSVL